MQFIVRYPNGEFAFITWSEAEADEYAFLLDGYEAVDQEAPLMSL